jgi:putative transposase
MDESESLSHSKWECKYHLVFIPMCRRKVLYEQLRRHLGEIFRGLAEQKQCRILEAHLMPDHVHMLISIPPKHAVSAVVGFIKGKSAIHLARVYGERRRNFVGQSFWARRYFVSTVGRAEANRPPPSANTSAPKRRETSDSISSIYGADRPPLGGAITAGPR